MRAKTLVEWVVEEIGQPPVVDSGQEIKWGEEC